MVALDGTKVAADAALDRNRDADWIRREVSKLMAATAEEEQGASVDAAAGLPGLEQAGEISGARGRVAQLQAALAVIEAEDAAVAAEAAKTAQAATAEAEQGRKLRGRTVYHLGVLLEALFPDAHRQMVSICIQPSGGWRRRLRVDGIGPTPWLTLVTDIRRVYSRARHSRAAAQSDAAGGEPKLLGRVGRCSGRSGLVEPDREPVS